MKFLWGNAVYFKVTFSLRNHFLGCLLINVFKTMSRIRKFSFSDRYSCVCCFLWLSKTAIFWQHFLKSHRKMNQGIHAMRKSELKRKKVKFLCAAGLELKALPQKEQQVFKHFWIKIPKNRRSLGANIPYSEKQFCFHKALFNFNFLH